MECYQTHGNQVFGVFDTIPLIPPQPLLWARTPKISCRQPPVLHTVKSGTALLFIWSAFSDWCGPKCHFGSLFLYFLPPFSPQLVVTVLSHRCNSRTDSGEAKVECRASSET
jgi:hypothetical protein